MLKQVLIGLLILVLAVFAYVGYSSYDARRATDGDVFQGEGRSSRPRTDMKVVPSETEPPPVTLPAMPTTSGSVPGNGSSMISPDGAAAQNAPVADSISPNPPNGMVFSGTGHFQLYRQGSLTWRLNTDNGQSCVLFATDEEWRKPKVYHAGCAGK